MNDAMRELVERVIPPDQVDPKLDEYMTKIHHSMCKMGLLAPNPEMVAVAIALFEELHPRDHEVNIPPELKSDFSWDEVEIGAKVIADFSNKERPGTLIDVAGLSEKGLLRIKIDGDKKDYREIPMEKVKMA